MNTLADNTLSSPVIQCRITEDALEGIIIFSDFFFFVFKEYLRIEIAVNFTAEPFLPFLVDMSVVRAIHIADNWKEVCLQVPHSICGCEHFTLDRRRKMIWVTRVRANSFKDFISLGFAKSSLFEYRLARIPRPRIKIRMPSFVFTVAQIVQQGGTIDFFSSRSIFASQSLGLVGNPLGMITPHPLAHARCSRRVQLADFIQYYFVFPHLFIISEITRQSYSHQGHKDKRFENKTNASNFEAFPYLLLSLAGSMSCVGNPLLADFLLVGQKLEKLGFTYHQSKVLILHEVE